MSGGRSVGIVRSRTQATEFGFVVVPMKKNKKKRLIPYPQVSHSISYHRRKNNNTNTTTTNNNNNNNNNQNILLSTYSDLKIDGFILLSIS
jgi:hypothetical protein